MASFDVTVKTEYADDPESKSQKVLTNKDAARQFPAFAFMLLDDNFNSFEYSVDLYVCSIHRVAW